MTTQQVCQELEQKINRGLQPLQGKKIVHTAPHHDDILLGYFPYILENLAHNTHHVLYMTSGANGVSDEYLAFYKSLSLQDIDKMDALTKQAYKFAIREAEAEKKWSIVAPGQVHVTHARAQFYTADTDASVAQAMQNDIAYTVAYLQAIQPDVVTILVEEPGIGPQSHHRSEQVVRAALAQCNFSHNVMILGYRNVWSSFSLEQASMIIPVVGKHLDQIEKIFQDCFVTQHSTRFISLFDQQPYDAARGDFMLQTVGFAQEAVAIQKAQLQQVIQALGMQHSHARAMVQKYQGAVYLQQLSITDETFR